MQVFIFVAQIITSVLFILTGIGLYKGFVNAKMDLDINGSAGFVEGAKKRLFILGLSSKLFFLFSLLLIYNAFTRNIF